jgi:hypothetical protein
MNRLSKQRMARFLFWALLIYTALSSTIAWSIQFGLIPVEPRRVQTLAEQKSPTNDIKELAFVEQFTREYFFWTQGKEASRKERLQPFLINNIDSQAGLDMKTSNFNSYVQNVNTWKVENRSGGIKELTVYAETILTNVSNTADQKRVDRYLVVSIKKAGDSYRVIDIPYLVPPPVAKGITMPDPQTDGPPITGDIANQVNAFMLTFWKVYTTGAPQEIAYYFKNKQLSSGLTSIESFVSMDNLAAFKVGDQYKVDCDITLRDVQTSAQLVSHYQFTLVNENGRWYVISVKQGEI